MALLAEGGSTSIWFSKILSIFLACTRLPEQPRALGSADCRWEGAATESPFTAVSVSFPSCLHDHTVNNMPPAKINFLRVNAVISIAFIFWDDKLLFYNRGCFCRWQYR